MASKPKMHIYTLSRLAFADVTEWTGILKSLQDGRREMFWSYKPVRQGAFELIRKGGTASGKVRTAVGNLAANAGGEKCRKANIAALEIFENRFLTTMGKPGTSFMENSYDEKPVDFGKVKLIGGPHFSVVDSTGRTRLVYLHPSRWHDDEVRAFCELLTVVVEARFDAEARDVWFLDLRTGRRVPWNASKKLVRRRCAQAADLLLTLQSAIGE